jgi:transcriptional regulator with GAF, ATPase, and Fis domain
MQTAAPAPDRTLLLDTARDVYAMSLDEWGPKKATVLVGRHPLLEEALAKVARFAAASSPVLITGDTGTGKELFARALFLYARRNRRTMLSVNCAQYVGTELVASELFGHRKGSFTGATADHRGIFEEAEGGFVFLDEVGELPL